MKIFKLTVFTGIGHQALFTKHEDAEQSVEDTWAGKKKPKYRIVVIPVHEEPIKLCETSWE